MMKFTLFVFAVLLVAVAFALPKPDEAATPEVKPFNMDEISKLLNDAAGNFKTHFDELSKKENMEKVQDVVNDGFKKLQEAVQAVMNTVEKKE